MTAIDFLRCLFALYLPFASLATRDKGVSGFIIRDFFVGYGKGNIYTSMASWLLEFSCFLIRVVGDA